MESRMPTKGITLHRGRISPRLACPPPAVASAAAGVNRSNAPQRIKQFRMMSPAYRMPLDGNGIPDSPPSVRDF